MSLHTVLPQLSDTYSSTDCLSAFLSSYFPYYTAAICYCAAGTSHTSNQHWQVSFHWYLHDIVKYQHCGKEKVDRHQKYCEVPPSHLVDDARTSLVHSTVVRLYVQYIHKHDRSMNSRWYMARVITDCELSKYFRPMTGRASRYPSRIPT